VHYRLVRYRRANPTRDVVVRYRLEPLVLVLVALAALPAVSLTGPQDRTRYELTRHLVLYHTLVLENNLFDRALYNGHTYSDKAPGMSFFAVPGYEFARVIGVAKAPVDWESEGDASLWLVRVLSSGVLFLCSVFVVGRLAERLVAGTGALTAATFGVATLAAPLAPTFFEHDAAGACAIAAFAVLWRGRSRWTLALAGLLAGTAVLFQYAAAAAALALTVYALWCHRRRVGWFLLGAVPAALALGAYDWAAFDSPFHLSYRYVANAYTERQHSGFFGIGAPTLDGIRQVLFGTRGLVVWSPVTIAAVVGLWLLWRRGRRAEATLCASVFALFILIDGGYFLPYGGGSPGPRFLGASLPFLTLGLPAAFARFRLPTVALVLVSAVTMSIDALSWGVRPVADSNWLPGRNDVVQTIWGLAGMNRDWGAVLAFAAALAAVCVGTAEAMRR
jgi:hypothetical protein